MSEQRQGQGGRGARLGGEIRPENVWTDKSLGPAAPALAPAAGFCMF